MNELERYKLKESEIMLNLENTGLRFAIDALIKALLAAEETIIAEDGE